jgi:serralysin
MPNTYKGDDGVDIVNQNATNDYFNIFTYGGDDEISLKLNKTYVEAGSGDDKVVSTIENNNDIFLGKGDDTYTGKGWAWNGRYDIVSGGEGSDTFNVSTRHSEYYGDEDADTFNSVGYHNYFFGGAGTDTVSYQRQDNSSLAGTGVRIDLFHEEALTGNGRVETLVNIENAIGTSYADDVIGDNGDNTLWGMEGRDIVDGRGGKDALFGGNGNDDIYGGGSADELTGGKGYDLMWGGSGADTFVFTSLTDSVTGSQRDVIKDFVRSEGDVIDLSAIDAVSGGGDDPFDFIGNSAFSGTAGELRFNNHILSGDTDGDGKADFEIRVNNISNMQDSDFIL